MTAIAASATSRVTPTRMGARARMAPAASPKTLTESPLTNTTAAPAPMACATITPWIPPATRAPCAHLRRSWGWGWDGGGAGIARHRSTVERVPTAIHPTSANGHPQLTGALIAPRKTFASRSTARPRMLSRSVALASRAPYTMRASPHPLCASSLSLCRPSSSSSLGCRRPFYSLPASPTPSNQHPPYES